MPRLLELFSGTGSVGRAFRAKGWEVVSVDINGAENPTIQADIRDLDVSSLGKIDAIWASPPCTNYSKARTNAKVSSDSLMSDSDDLVRKTLAIAAELGNPPMWIENPWTGMLKTRELLDHLTMNVVDYCMYGDGVDFPYRKRTAVWTSTGWTPSRPLCKYDCLATVPGMKKHKAIAQRGPPGQTFTQRELYRIPPKLCDEIAEYCDNRIVLFPS